jgi:RNA recognition motif-containing protein
MPGTEPEAIRNLMVNYIPTTIDEMQLRQLFEMYGPIDSLKIVCDRETRQSRGYGFVKYRFGASAVHAIQYLNGYPLMNKRLKVAYANATEAQKLTPQVDPAAAAYIASVQAQQQLMAQQAPFAMQQQQLRRQ